MTKTLADTLAVRESLYVNCLSPNVRQIGQARYSGPQDRLGPDHGSMPQDLIGLFGARTARLPAGIGGPCSSPASLTMKAKIGIAIATGSRLSIAKAQVPHNGSIGLAPKLHRQMWGWVRTRRFANGAAGSFNGCGQPCIFRNF